MEVIVVQVVEFAVIVEQQFFLLANPCKFICIPICAPFCPKVSELQIRREGDTLLSFSL